ncbi:MAG: hypothetical protein PSX80_03720 [bacterium]|nr:hypothetical protein [bacterium]
MRNLPKTDTTAANTIADEAGDGGAYRSETVLCSDHTESAERSQEYRDHPTIQQSEISAAGSAFKIEADRLENVADHQRYEQEEEADAADDGEEYKEIEIRSEFHWAMSRENGAGCTQILH